MMQWLLLLWALLAGYVLVSYLVKADRWLAFGSIVCLGIICTFGMVKERLRRRKEGYYVYKRGGATDGALIYNEHGNLLQLYFNRRADTIYVPSDREWRKVMPDWAKERKEEILTRIKARIGKRLVGKSWTYKETDKSEFMVRNS